MVDFNKIREERRRQAEEIKKNSPATIIRQQKPDYLMRINHLIEYHLGVMTEWETNFVYNTKEFIINVPEVKTRPEILEHILTEKVKSKIAELEAQFCTAVCHGLMKANIPHV